MTHVKQFKDRLDVKMKYQCLIEDIRLKPGQFINPERFGLFLLLESIWDRGGYLLDGKNKNAIKITIVQQSKVPGDTMLQKTVADIESALANPTV